MTDEQLVLHESADGVTILTLNRPKALNALSPELMDQLIAHVQAADEDEAVRCLIITGGPRVFAAGADIKAMAEASPMHMQQQRTIAKWQKIHDCRKPIIAAVSGYALGGGCELAMMCDMIVASETAQFGQPEINIGIIPGAGGTQRLAAAVGPYRAMEMVLTGRNMNVQEAFAAGLVNRIAPVDGLLDEARRLAAEIAARPPLAVQLAKEAVRYGVETTVRDGMEIERRNFYMLFSSEDQKEGMRAFIEKRKPKYQGR